jgi:hypothetical protein
MASSGSSHAPRGLAGAMHGRANLINPARRRQNLTNVWLISLCRARNAKQNISFASFIWAKRGVQIPRSLLREQLVVVQRPIIKALSSRFPQRHVRNIAVIIQRSQIRRVMHIRLKVLCGNMIIYICAHGHYPRRSCMMQYLLCVSTTTPHREHCVYLLYTELFLFPDHLLCLRRAMFGKTRAVLSRYK